MEVLDNIYEHLDKYEHMNNNNNNNNTIIYNAHESEARNRNLPRSPESF